MMIVKTQQLKLIESDPVWKLDDHTREVGRVGLSNARAILHSARFAASESVTAEDESTHRQAA